MCLVETTNLDRAHMELSHIELESTVSILWLGASIIGFLSAWFTGLWCDHNPSGVLLIGKFSILSSA